MEKCESQIAGGNTGGFSKWKRCLVWFLIALPPLGLALLIREHKVNFPYLDDWMFVSMLEKAKLGTLTFHDFWMAQMEHRIAFVRALILIRHWLSPLDLSPQYWLSWAFITGTAINVLLLMRRTFGDIRRWWMPMFLSSMILFTPLQYQIVLWAMMFQVAGLAFFLSTAMVALLSERLPAWTRFAVAVICAECGTLSFASGLQTWILMIPLIIWAAPFTSQRQRWIFLGVWIGVFAATAGVYFHNLKNEADPAFSYGAGEEEVLKEHVGGFLSDPRRGVRFIAGFLGGNIARGTSAPLFLFSMILGAISLVMISIFSIWWLLRFRDVEMRRRWLPWLLFGGYSVGTAVLTAMGRAWATQYGESSLSARYVIHGIPLTVSLIVLGCLAAEELQKRRPQCHQRVLMGKCIAATALFLIFANGWMHGAQIMEVWESSRLRGATSALFFNVLETEGNIVSNHTRAVPLNDLGLLNPPFLKNTRLDNFQVASKKLSASYARLDRMAVAEGKLVAYGIAALQRHTRVADGIFLGYKDDKGDWIIFHVTQVRQMPMYLYESLDRDLRHTHIPLGSKSLGQALASFTATCPISRIPPGRREVRAWAFDYRKKTAYPMEGRFIVDSADRDTKEMKE